MIKQIAKTQKASLIQYSIVYDEFKTQGKLEPKQSKLYIWVIQPNGKVVFRQVDLKPLWQQKSTSLKQLSTNSPTVLTAPPNFPTVVTSTPKTTLEIPLLWTYLRLIALLTLGIAIWYGRFLLTPQAAQNIKPKYRWLLLSFLFLLGTGSSGGLFLTMTNNQKMAKNQPDKTDSSLLEELVSSTRSSIGIDERGLGLVLKGQNASQSDHRLKQLYQILIQPIADLLPTDPNAPIIFIPQRSLFLVPFPALQDAKGKYLIEKHTILTAPSIQVLDLTRKQKQRLESIYKVPLQSKDALIVGNPTMPSVPPQIGEPPQQLPSLPGAETEAKSIATVLQTQAITGNQATKQSILQKLPNARIVHLATHGLLDDIRGLGSAIALAPSNKDNGLLTAEEILDLKLNAELVVLSACDTGRGRITGDGVVGLSRSLILAGVPSIIVSLWSVPDAPTASLMTEFYQNLQKNPNRSVALRQAMLTTMKHHPNPRDWAAFTLIGEAE